MIVIYERQTMPDCTCANIFITKVCCIAEIGTMLHVSLSTFRLCPSLLLKMLLKLSQISFWTLWTNPLENNDICALNVLAEVLCRSRIIAVASGCTIVIEHLFAMATRVINFRLHKYFWPECQKNVHHFGSTRKCATAITRSHLFISQTQNLRCSFTSSLKFLWIMIIPFLDYLVI